MSEWSGRPPGEAATRDGAQRRDTEASLRAMMRDPRYWRDRDPEWIRRVSDGFRRLVDDDPSQPDRLYTPAEVAAAVAAEREACAARLDKVAADQTNPASAAFIALQAAVLRRRASGGDALAAHTARVRREALEEAARKVEATASGIQAVARNAKWGAAYDERAAQAGVIAADYAAALMRGSAADIRALIGGDDAAG